MNTTSSVIYSILEWITRFAYVNLLWILFSLLGVIIVGFFPSTIAMFAIVRDWIRGDTEKPVFKTFWNYFKAEFWKSNRLGILLMVIVCIIGIDLWYIQINLNELLTWTYTPLFAFMVLFLLFLFYIFPAFVHYDLKLLQLIKNAFLIMLINPIHTILIVLCLGSLYFVMHAVPALAFIFGGSSYAFITMWLCLHAFNKIQRKQEK